MAVKGGGGDRRVQKTRSLLRKALGELIHEKPYDEIVVKEILDRANVGRSTFYTHFRDRDELLADAMHHMLRSIPVARIPAPKSRKERLLRFSLPIFAHINGHRQQ